MWKNKLDAKSTERKWNTLLFTQFEEEKNFKSFLRLFFIFNIPFFHSRLFLPSHNNSLQFSPLVPKRGKIIRQVRKWRHTHMHKQSCYYCMRPREKVKLDHDMFCQQVYTIFLSLSYSPVLLCLLKETACKPCRLFYIVFFPLETDESQNG